MYLERLFAPGHFEIANFSSATKINSHPRVGWFLGTDYVTGWSSMWLVGRLVCWLVGWLFGWVVGWLVGWLVCLLDQIREDNMDKGRVQ